MIPDYKATIAIKSGAGSAQERNIVDYTGATKVATISPRWSMNMLSYPSQFDNAVWTKANATITPNVIAASDGTLTADKLVENTSNSVHDVSRLNISGSVDGDTAIVVAEVKKAERIGVQLYCQRRDTTPSWNVTFFNFDTKTFTGTTAGCTVDVQTLPDGWYRIWLRGSLNSGTSVPDWGLRLISVWPFTTTYVGDGTSGAYVARAQIEFNQDIGDFIDGGANPVTLPNATTVYEITETRIPTRIAHSGTAQAGSIDSITLSDNAININFPYEDGEIDQFTAMHDRLPHHMESSNNLKSLLTVHALAFQQIEAVLFDLEIMRTIDIATGIQLDGIGQIINVTRIVGQTDDSYRFALKTAMIILTKSGEPESVIEAYLIVMGASVVEYLEIYPAAFQISAQPTVDINDPDTAAFITATMNAVKAAGVRMVLATVAAFTLAQYSETNANGDGPLSATQGFGDANVNTADTLLRTATGNHHIRQVVTTTAHANKLHTFYVSLKAGTLTGDVRLRIQDGAGAEIAAQSFTPSASWQKFQISGSFGASPAANIQAFIDPVNDTGSAGDSLQMWGAMLFETTNTDLNMLVAGSEFSNAAWLKTNATVTENAVVDPYNGAGGGLARVS
jgi:hypothetical protein